MSVVRAALLSTALVVCLVAMPVPAVAGDCNGAADGVEDGYTLQLTCAEAADEKNGDGEPSTAQAYNQPTYSKYKWHSPCAPFSAQNTVEGSPDCGIARTCPSPDERSWQLWGFSTATGRWEYITSECISGPPPAVDVPRPQITAAMVLNAIRRIGLPSLQAHTQPAGKTLVNFETIFYAEPQTFTRTIQLLGQRVDIEATPSQFTWLHGDGTSATTRSPGAPYPSKEITYNYTDAHTTVTPSVDVTYTARFRVNGGAWQNISETVTIPGPTGSLRISEAIAVLSGEYE